MKKNAINAVGAKDEAKNIQIGADPVDQTTGESIQTKPERGRRKRRARLVLIGVLAALAIVMLLDVYAIAMANRVLPGVRIGSTSFANLAKPEVVAKMQQLTEQAKTKKLAVAVAIKDKTLSSDELGFSLDALATADKLLAYGHKGSGLTGVWPLISSLFVSQSVSPVATLNEDRLTTWVSDAAKEVDQPEQQPTLTANGGTVSFVPGKEGQRIDQAALAAVIKQRFLAFSMAQVKVEPMTVKPTEIADQGQAAVTSATLMLKAPLKLVFPGGATTLKPSQLEPLISAQIERGQLNPAVDQDKLHGLIDDLATSYDVEAIGARLKIDNGQVSVLSDSKAGVVTDRSAAADQVSKELLARASGQASVTSLTLASKKVDSDISAAGVANLGIKELIGTATTSFVGSPQNRIHNIKTGVSFLTGIVIKPGEEFSTIKLLGNIDGSTGYLPELVIKENATIPEFGGGLCQVSTTLFRAAMNAGLPITARTNHSYRVPYYEVGVGPGLDATVYSPKPDFKFKNDSPGAILVQGYVSGNNVSFEIYGTKDGRQSQIVGPSTLSTAPPPDSIYTDTDTLPVGVTKQTDHAHPGATTTATYIVRRDGKEINRQVFSSHYKPWPAKFLVGTKTDVPADQPADQPPAQ